VARANRAGSLFFIFLDFLNRIDVFGILFTVPLVRSCRVLLVAFYVLAYQPVLPHGLIRITIKIRLIANNYNYLSHFLFHLLNIQTHTLRYIFIII